MRSTLSTFTDNPGRGTGLISKTDVWASHAILGGTDVAEALEVDGVAFKVEACTCSPGEGD